MVLNCENLLKSYKIATVNNYLNIKFGSAALQHWQQTLNHTYNWVLFISQNLAKTVINMQVSWILWRHRLCMNVIIYLYQTKYVKITQRGVKS